MTIKLKQIFKYLLAICIILNCETVWCWKDHSGYYKITLFIISIISLLYLIIEKKEKLKKKSFIKICFLVIYCLILIVINFSNSFTNIINLIQFVSFSILFVWYCEDKENIKEILKIISNIMIILGGCSLIIFLFGNIFNILKPNGSIIIYVNNIPKQCETYFGIQFNIQQEEIFGNGLYRNTGIFYEAPKYSLLLVLSLMYEVFYSDKYNLKRIIILSLTIFSTMSLTGIYANIIILFSFIIFRYNKRKISGNIIRAILMVILVIMGPILSDKIQTTFDIKYTTASYGTRIDNYIAGYKAWLENPILGSGYMNMNKIIENYSQFRNNDLGYSNSIFRVLAQGGVYLMFIYAYPILKNIIKVIKDKNINQILGNLMFVYLFITTSFPYNYIIVVWLVHFHILSNEKKGENNFEKTKEYMQDQHNINLYNI